VQEGVVPVKLPLQVVLPLGSAIVGGGLAVLIGLGNLALADAYSHTEPVIFASVILLLTMVGAGFLSARYPDPPDADEIQSRH
jgi:prepilin signal peptidase PulO-like enzyme (type II secretory pathway)